MTFISIDGVSKQYHNGSGIRDVNLSIEKGSFVSIVGPFGSGKTTLLRTIAGLATGFTGTISIDGNTPKQAKKLHKIGYSFQHPTLLPWRNVIENITLPQEIVSKKDKSKARHLLKLVGLSSIEKKYVHELSGGMKQLVSILRSLILDPDILLLDEPFSSIDELSKDKLHEKLLTIHKNSHKTTVLVTHSLQEAVFLSDVIIVMTKNPGSVKKVITVDFPRKTIADKYSIEAIKYVQRIRKELELS